MEKWQTKKKDQAQKKTKTIFPHGTFFESLPETKSTSLIQSNSHAVMQSPYFVLILF